MSKRKATIYDYARMCENTSCKECGLYSTNNVMGGVSCQYLVSHYPDKANDTILKWCDEHPVKTYKDDFFEKFPNARAIVNDYPAILPCRIYSADKFQPCCTDCKQCWDKAMEE